MTDNRHDQTLPLLGKMESSQTSPSGSEKESAAGPLETSDLFQSAKEKESQGELSEATRLYREIVVRKAPSELLGHALYRLGWISMEHKQFVDAADFFWQASEAFGGPQGSAELRVDSSYWAALCLEASGQIIRAVALYDKVAAEPSWYFDATYRRILCCDKLGLFQEALGCCHSFEQAFQQGKASERSIPLRAKVLNLKAQFERILNSEN